MHILLTENFLDQELQLVSKQHSLCVTNFLFLYIGLGFCFLFNLAMPTQISLKSLAVVTQDQSLIIIIVMYLHVSSLNNDGSLFLGWLSALRQVSVIQIHCSNAIGYSLHMRNIVADNQPEFLVGSVVPRACAH